MWERCLNIRGNPLRKQRAIFRQDCRFVSTESSSRLVECHLQPWTLSLPLLHAISERLLFEFGLSQDFPAAPNSLQPPSPMHLPIFPSRLSSVRNVSALRSRIPWACKKIWSISHCKVRPQNVHDRQVCLNLSEWIVVAGRGTLVRLTCSREQTPIFETRPPLELERPVPPALSGPPPLPFYN
jgi:hypothetical protein